MKKKPEPEAVDPGPLAARFAEALLARNMTQTELMNLAGWPSGYGSFVLTGKRRKLSPEMLQCAAMVLRVDYEWLATGAGDMDRRSGRGGKRLEGPLELAIGYWATDGRTWSAAAVAAAQVMARVKALTGPQWAAKLDEIEKGLESCQR